MVQRQRLLAAPTKSHPINLIVALFYLRCCEHLSTQQK